MNLSRIRSLYSGSAGGARFDLAWVRDGGGNGMDLQNANYVLLDVLSERTQIDAISTVPEPAAWVLEALGLGFLSLKVGNRTILERFGLSDTYK